MGHPSLQLDLPMPLLPHTCAATPRTINHYGAVLFNLPQTISAQAMSGCAICPTRRTWPPPPPGLHRHLASIAARGQRGARAQVHFQHITSLRAGGTVPGCCDRQLLSQICAAAASGHAPQRASQRAAAAAAKLPA